MRAVAADPPPVFRGKMMVVAGLGVISFCYVRGSAGGRISSRMFRPIRYMVT